MKFKKQIPYEILITPTVNGGFLVKCGCVVTVYTNHLELIADLSEYLVHPEEVEKQCNKHIMISTLIRDGVQLQERPVFGAGMTASGMVAAHEQEMMRQREEGERSHEI